MARLSEAWASLRGLAGANGLLLSKRLYEEAGGDLGKLKRKMRPLAARAFREA